MRQALLPVALLLMFQTTAADAQPSDRAGPIASQVPTRINVGSTISQRLSTISIEERRRAERAVRRRLYEMAMEAIEECELIIDVFQAECKITSLNVSSNVQDQDGGPMIYGNVNGQYEIGPRR